MIGRYVVSFIFMFSFLFIIIVFVELMCRLFDRNSTRAVCALRSAVARAVPVARKTLLAWRAAPNNCRR